MPMVTWVDSFLLDIPQFDEHHQQLVKLLNDAYENFTSGESAEAVDQILEQLVDYAAYHFSAEELWLQQHDYPLLTGHIEEHNRFTAKVLEMLREPHYDVTFRLLEVMSFLNGWLTDHILNTDAEYARFVKSN